VSGSAAVGGPGGAGVAGAGPEPGARRPDLTIVFAYRRTNTYGPHVVLGALEVLAPPGTVDVVFAIGVDELVGAVRDAAARSATVLVAWSFYSPEFLRSADELAAVRAVAAGPAPVVHLAGGAHASAEPLATLLAG
jgi:hypothetical protein